MGLWSCNRALVRGYRCNNDGRVLVAAATVFAMHRCAGAPPGCAVHDERADSPIATSRVAARNDESSIEPNPKESNMPQSILYPQTNQAFGENEVPGSLRIAAPRGGSYRIRIGNQR